jgi:DNA-binding HxlR family transcriptional regulator
MAEYHQYCPVARACEIFADRWTPLLVRELLFGSRHFNAIKRGLPGISRSLLVSRLRLLDDSGVLERHAGKRPTATEYVLTEAGIDLKKVLEGLGQWGVKWAFGEPKPDELDAALLLWMMRRWIHRHLLPSARCSRIRPNPPRRATTMAGARAKRDLAVSEASRLRFGSCCTSRPIIVVSRMARLR